MQARNQVAVADRPPSRSAWGWGELRKFGPADALGASLGNQGASIHRVSLLALWVVKVPSDVRSDDSGRTWKAQGSEVLSLMSG